MALIVLGPGTTVDVVNIGNASALLLAANSKANMRCVKNVSNTDIFINLGGTAVEDKGIVLAARAATKEDSCLYFPFHGVMFYGAIYGIAGAADKDLMVFEC